MAIEMMMISVAGDDDTLDGIPWLELYTTPRKARLIIMIRSKNFTSFTQTRDKLHNGRSTPSEYNMQAGRVEWSIREIS